MAKKVKKKVQTPVLDTEPTTKHLLKRDYPTTKGVLKAGKDYIEVTERAKRILTAKNII